VALALALTLSGYDGDIAGLGDDVARDALELGADLEDTSDLAGALVLQLGEELDEGLHEPQIGAGARVGRGMDDVCEESEEGGDGEVEYAPGKVC